jgi:hypothetical protein
MSFATFSFSGSETYFVGSIGYPAFRQAFVPPSSANESLIPFFCNSATKLALVCSFAQEQ